MRIRMKRNQLLMMILAAGFLCGIFYINKTGTELQVFDESTFSYLRITEMDYRAYLVYILRERVGLLVAVLFFSFVKWKRIYAGLLTGVTGMLLGTLLTGAVLQLGIKGMIWCMAGVLPHMIFYGLAYGILLWYWFTYAGSKWNRTKTIAVILLFSLGVVTEVYVNPWIVRGVMNLIL